MDTRDLYLIKDSVILVDTSTLESQCKNGDFISVCKVFSYRIKWENIQRELYYYTNLSYNKLICFILTEYSVPISDWGKYRLKRQGQYISLEAFVPFEGISDEIEVVNIYRRWFGCTQSRYREYVSFKYKRRSYRY